MPYNELHAGILFFCNHQHLYQPLLRADRADIGKR